VQRLKPAASVTTQLLLAAALWSTVGGVLLSLGLRWSIVHLAPMAAAGLALSAVMIGIAKERWVLVPVARRIAARIRARGDGRCLGGALSWQSWAVVVAMMAGGRLLRSVAPAELVGPLYVAVGSALVLASRHLWVARTTALPHADEPR
jgi:hypothetical protein